MMVCWLVGLIFVVGLLVKSSMGLFVSVWVIVMCCCLLMDIIFGWCVIWWFKLIWLSRFLVWVIFGWVWEKVIFSIIFLSVVKFGSRWNVWNMYLIWFVWMWLWVGLLRWLVLRLFNCMVFVLGWVILVIIWSSVVFLLLFVLIKIVCLFFVIW